MNFLKEIKKYSLVAIIVSIIMGIFFLFFPATSMTYMALAVGVALIVMGISAIIGYIANKNTPFTLALGIITALAGIVVCIKFETIISIIIAVIGIFILTTGVFNLITGIKVLFSHMLTGWLTLALAITQIVLGIIALTKTGEFGVAVIQLLGASLIVYSIMAIVSYAQVKKMVQKVQDDIDLNSEIESSATIVQETDDNE